MTYDKITIELTNYKKLYKYKRILEWNDERNKRKL